MFVRSNPGPEGLQKALNEQGSQGYRLDVAWKDGNDFVAMLSRLKDGAKNAAFVVDTPTVDKMHWVKGLYLADAPYKGEERLVVSRRRVWRRPTSRTMRSRSHDVRIAEGDALEVLEEPPRPPPGLRARVVADPPWIRQRLLRSTVLSPAA